MFNLETATHLPNGAQILQWFRLDLSSWVVLAYWEGRTAPYVTWKSDYQGNAYWGNYFRARHDAENDYEVRTGGNAIPAVGGC